MLANPLDGLYLPQQWLWQRMLFVWNGWLTHLSNEKPICTCHKRELLTIYASASKLWFSLSLALFSSWCVVLRWWSCQREKPSWICIFNQTKKRGNAISPHIRVCLLPGKHANTLWCVWLSPKVNRWRSHQPNLTWHLPPKSFWWVLGNIAPPYSLKRYCNVVMPTFTCII